jgi:phenylalanyl-tRNA synthetase beta chain
MLCSEEELGLAEKSAGIMELPEETPIGVTLLTLWEKTEDVIFDIDNKSLTHRPDLWGHFGMAREFAALYEVPHIVPFDDQWRAGLESKIDSNSSSPITVDVDKNSSCKAYLGLSVDNIKVGESPRYIKDRLLAVGLRPINNIVDISNYVMLELGMPLHIFDRKKITGPKVSISALDKETTFTTLDEVERTLVPGDTVISDSEKPLVLAGIMGGLNSGVDETTSGVFIEVANWDAAKVRSTSTRLGLRTDSSMRYEKTLDSQLCYRTLLRTFELLLEICPEAKAVGKVEYDGEDLNSFIPLDLNISIQEITKTLGKDIPTQKVVSILESLDFKVQKKDECLSVTVPSYRSTKDIECPADIIEEIGRMIGYDNISPEGPLVGVTPIRLSTLAEMKRKAQDFLSQYAKALEVTTYPMIGESLLKKSQWDNDNAGLKLINSLSVEHDRMRDSLIPSFLEVAALNAKNFESFRFFEWGRTYSNTEEDFAQEKQVLGVCYFSKSKSPSLDLVDDIEALCKFLNIPMDFAEAHPKFKNEIVNEEWVGCHPYEFKNLRIMGKMKGAVLGIHPIILKQFKIKGNLSMAFIDLSLFEDKAPKAKSSYKPLPKFPASRFDYTVTLAKGRSVEEIFNALKKVKVGGDVDHKIVDIYSPEKDESHVTMGTFITNKEKTLSGEEIKEYEEKIIKGLEKANIFLKKG